MGTLNVVLTVLFIIVSILLVFIVAIQDEQSDGLGGVFGGAAQASFGSYTSSVVTKATAILGASFMILSLCIALVNRAPSDDKLLDSVDTNQVQQSQTWWVNSPAEVN
ncbi:MAG: preprotein translocase subunit SecG [Sphaerochaeta sp.]|jgi:preprotein translocase subunit SecG